MTEYTILNQYGAKISGGERAEFNLIDNIDGAAQSDMLLIDEPESSFDNIFLSSSVLKTIKNIAENTPVVLVTHNNSVGASIKPDYVIFTERTIVDNEPTYNRFSGKATDKVLLDSEGKEKSNYDVMIDYLEAGKNNYSERTTIYEMLKNR